ncbi:phosphoenolpyruvate--protein phosphotransferase [Actinoplanes sp. CA-142083]|uniref:phosphoenolpyruvate--protein phosphotransferase n=1 Tax=Actinoplanes sp. CA-142083 TaxID=3239903 RepID=UPI003D9382E0
MVGLVVVSHSRALASAAVELASAMLQDQSVRIEMAAGLDESTLGTDAVAISSAVTAADQGDGVVILMDLGSAVLSAEMALEMVDDEVRERAVLCPAPLVEGLVAAVVAAAGGAGRDEVAAEAIAALEAKQSHLGEPSPTGNFPKPPETSAELSRAVTISNPHGLHARPAARLVTTASRFEAHVEIRNRTTGSAWVRASSLSRVATLGVLRGHEIELRASGPQAREAVDELVDLAARAFDEAGEAPASAQPDLSEISAQAAAGRGRGRAASGGVGIGPAWQPAATASSALPDISEISSQGAEVEARRLDDAVAAVRRDIGDMRAAASDDEAAADIFGAHLLLLDDAELLSDVSARIQRGDAAPRAFREATERVAVEFEALPDPYLNARAADVRAVGDQVVRRLLGLTTAALDGDGVLIAGDLTPAEAAGLDPRRVAGVLLAGGSPTAHAAIISRARNIPMVVGAGKGVLGIAPATTIALDGGSGEFSVAPDETVVVEFRDRAVAREARRRKAAERAHDPAVTGAGVTILVAANLGSVPDARAAAENGADQAGLVRTEFLFLDRDEAPGVDEQVAVYRQIAEAMHGRRITLRTLDVGGDKPLRYAPSRPEQNPFLGVRGLRHSLENPALFGAQLDAMVHVARETPVSVMFPMVTSVEELIAARRMLDDRHPPEGLEVGIMVEVPAAALKVETFRPYVDFVSIGTNDLTQYTLAAERGNPSVPADGLDPAVLRLIDAVCRNAGVPVAVCGELATDETAVPLLTALGVHELSVTPTAVPLVKEAVRASGTGSAAWAFELPDAAAVRRRLNG